MMNEKGELVAYLVMESASDPIKPKNLQVGRENGLFYVRFDSVLQAFNRQNRNRRKYMSGPMVESLNAPHILELIKNRTWFGEAGHPMQDDPKRILTIDPRITSHRINSFSVNGDILTGNVETLDDSGGVGSKFTKNILQGMEPAFSLRALAQLTKFRDGSAVVQSRSHIVCYDWVILPSHPEAYRDTSKPIQKVIKDLGSDNLITESASMVSVTESQIADFIRMESKNLKAVSNVYDVALESMELTTDLKNVILRENGQTFIVKTDDVIRKEISRYMSRL